MALTKAHPFGVVQVRVNRSQKSEDGFWHKWSDYYELERVISNVITCEDLQFQGFVVKPEKIADMSAELRLSTELFEQVFDSFTGEDILLKQAGSLLFTFSLSSEASLGKLTIEGQEVTSWTFYPDELLDVVPAPRQPTVTVGSQDELDNLLSTAGEAARRKREAAVMNLRAQARAAQNTAVVESLELPLQWEAEATQETLEALTS